MAQTGDIQAFNQLVGQWYPRVYNFALKYIGNQDLALEIAQKTFVSVYQNLSSLKEPGKFRFWMYRIATNHCHEEGRKKKRRSVFVSLEQETESAPVGTQWESASPGPEAKLHQRDLATMLARALEQVPEEQRIVIIMKEYEELTFKEIAQALEISENTAKSRLYYGLSKMKKCLKKWNINKETMHYER